MRKEYCFILNSFLAILWLAVVAFLVNAVQYFPHQGFENDLLFWRIGPVGSLTNRWIIVFEMVLAAPVFAILNGTKFWKLEIWYKFREGFVMPLAWIMVFYGLTGLLGYAFNSELNGSLVTGGILGIGLFITKNWKPVLATALCSIMPWLYWQTIGLPDILTSTGKSIYFYNIYTNISEILQWTFVLMGLVVFLGIQVWKFDRKTNRLVN